ncbi:histidine kinase [Lutibacter sp. Hel_I_33_5]|uniref:sensor histidine kinase n=1 Tax=Lutibacter sp. Hel_I_33_5 TaxID=1566289 RepID=UPI0011AA3509|nr:histidine kinase [Lutibacter sp. Hel_I_33_5]TVZ54903.1 histidine kinase [Lutibacter sp. Hel_I_33_5]
MFAWLFWATAEIVSWRYNNKKTDFQNIFTVTFLQSILAFIFNIAVIHIFLRIQKINKNNSYKYFLYGFIIISFSALIVFFNSTIYFRLFRNSSEFIDLPNIIINTLEKIIYLAGFTIVYFMIRNLKQLQAQKEETLAAKKLALESELQLLQQQINPHFLFNTLNSLRNLITNDTEKARNMVDYISEFLRSSININDIPKKEIQEELKLLDNYLNIQKIRWEKDLVIQKDISKNTLTILVPSLILQPLVENAIKHGMKSGQVLTIAISIQKENDYLSILVSNNGELKGTKKGNGTSNIIKRLQLLYKNDASFKLYEKNGFVYSDVNIKI